MLTGDEVIGELEESPAFLEEVAMAKEQQRLALSSGSEGQQDEEEGIGAA